MEKYSFCTANGACYTLLKKFAIHNRRFLTPAESILWNMLRGRQLGKPFRRQHVIGMFIADFVCLPAMLVIELDGRYHSLPEQNISDEERTVWLNRHGFDVIRFTNDEVMCNIEYVLNIIKDKIK